MCTDAITTGIQCMNTCMISNSDSLRKEVNTVDINLTFTACLFNSHPLSCL